MNEKSKHRILLILTGGTICSFADQENEERVSDVALAQTLIVQNFRNSSSVYREEASVSFDPVCPLDVLSENITTTHWNTLMDAMRTYDYTKYDGVILLHGTDTLAYTASLLSVLLAGLPIPVILVSSQLPIYMEQANGNANFRAAVELILGGILPNVYAVYRNREIVNGKDTHTMYLHYAAHLLQCANGSENFYSCDMIALDQNPAVAKGHQSKGTPILKDCGELSDCVLRITPYVGINYRNFNLRGIRAVLHGTYHSYTLAVDAPKNSRSQSVLSLKSRCDRHKPPIPLFLEPCNEDAYSYETTGHILRSGARGVFGMTSEMTYVKLLIGCAMGYSADKLEGFLRTEINGECIL